MRVMRSMSVPAQTAITEMGIRTKIRPDVGGQTIFGLWATRQANAVAIHSTA